jgi:hypothetical protein
MTETELAAARIAAARDLTLKVIDRMGIPPEVYKRRDPADAGRFVADIYREIYRTIAEPG